MSHWTHAEPPHLIAVNVGRPAPLGLGDRVVPSGIVKHAAAGPVAIDALGVEGDEQADRVNHGGPYKAVYAYAREDVTWWEAEIRRPIEPASFGENLTLAGVDVTGARIGERWRIGSVELEVSGPRVPCRSSARAWATRSSRASSSPPGARRVPLGPHARHAAGAATKWSSSDRPDHGVSVGLLYEVALRAPWRLPELEPARRRT